MFSCTLSNSEDKEGKQLTSIPTIDLDDASCDGHIMPSPKLHKRKRKADDAVIFVSETLRNGSADGKKKDQEVSNSMQCRAEKQRLKSTPDISNPSLAQ